MKPAKHKEAITKGYKEFLAGLPGSEDRLYTLLLEFARVKILPYLKKQDELATTSEDVAQDVVVKAWTNIEKFRENPDGFFHWFKSKCHFYGLDRLDKTKSENAKKITLMVYSESLGTLEDNPVIYGSQAGYPYEAELPDWLQSRDRRLIEFLIDGQSFEQIAETFGISKLGIQTVVRRIKEKMKNAKG